jgi:hypothetical protein
MVGTMGKTRDLDHKKVQYNGNSRKLKFMLEGSENTCTGQE